MSQNFNEEKSEPHLNLVKYSNIVIGAAKDYQINIEVVEIIRRTTSDEGFYPALEAHIKARANSH